jgi:signal transduction histidine kinase
MTPREIELRNLLRLEVANKSTQSSAAFIVFALFIFFYCFDCKEFAWVIKSSTAMIMTVSVLRLFLAKKIKAKGHVSSRAWKLMVFYIWMNALGWSLVFNFASYELKLAGIHFIVVTTMLAGFVAASLVTLAYDSILFLPFQFLLLVPQIGIVTYFYLGPEKFNALPLIPIYIMYLVYQMKQFKDFKNQLTQRFNYQLDLEHSNEELQKSQAALIDQTTKLVHTSRLAALGEMSAGIAHEVNNPLAIISGSMQQIEKIVNRGETDSQSILKLSAKSLQSIDRVTKIIKGLKHFSQQSDSLPKVHISLNEIIDDTASFCSEMLAARYIKLEIDTVPEVDLECHPVQISQVLINLIKNAEDAIGNEVNEQERWIKISFKQRDGFVTVEVINGGPVIPADIHDKLFQPFFTTKVVGKGTGLGLSISHGIMKEHKGDLIFDHSAKHTTFAMLLPTR